MTHDDRSRMSRALGLSLDYRERTRWWLTIGLAIIGGTLGLTVATVHYLFF